MLRSEAEKKYASAIAPEGVGNDLLISIENGVITITLNRPKKFNSFTNPMYTKIAELLDDYNKREDVKCVVLKANGPNYSAGNDLSNFMKFDEVGDPEAMKTLSDYLGDSVLLRFIQAFIDFNKPIIACVHGKVIGIAFTILSLCDIIYADAGTTFQAPFLSTRQGPEACSSMMFPKIFGKNLAFELLSLNKVLTVKEANDANFVSQIFPNCEQMYTSAFKVAEQFANSDYETLVGIKRLLKTEEDKSKLIEIAKKENTHLIGRWNSDSFKEFVLSFMTRKNPKL